MPDNNNKIDLSGDLDNIANDLLNDVKAATAEVQKRQAKLAENDAKDAKRAKSQKTMMIVAAVSAVVIFLIAYVVVFSRPDTSATNAAAPNTYRPVRIKNPGVPGAKPRVPAAPAATVVTPTAPAASGARDPQVVEHPSDDYEQPSDGGM